MGHHHCKFVGVNDGDRSRMQCRCFCHNKEMDRSFAYHPQKRYFWKREVKKIQVRSDEDATPTPSTPLWAKTRQAGFPCAVSTALDTLLPLLMVQHSLESRHSLPRLLGPSMPGRSGASHKEERLARVPPLLCTRTIASAGQAPSVLQRRVASL